ncbi:MAG: 30S ribosomal protein S24e [Candidatus Thorarchaeota archaeon]
MEITITSEKDNRILQRKEYEGTIIHNNEPTPGRIVIRDKVAALTNSDANRTIIAKIGSEFGIGKSKLTFRIYDNPEMMKKVELPHFLKRNGHVTEEKDN